MRCQGGPAADLVLGLASKNPPPIHRRGAIEKKRFLSSLARVGVRSGGSRPNLDNIYRFRSPCVWFGIELHFIAFV